MGYELSKSTAAKLKQLLARPDIATPVRTSSGSVSRYDTFVIIDSDEDSDGWHIGYCTDYDWQTNTWIEHESEVLVRDANDSELEVGVRYWARCYGVKIATDSGSAEQLIFVAASATAVRDGSDSGSPVDPEEGDPQCITTVERWEFDEALCAIHAYYVRSCFPSCVTIIRHYPGAE